MMNYSFINIITPCTRLNNLKAIAKSINIPSINYRWLIILDKRYFIHFSFSAYNFIIALNNNYIPEIYFFQKRCEVYRHKNPKSVYGNSQRNFAIDKTEKGYAYCLDDDTELHPDFWNSVKMRNEDFIYFQQSYKGGVRFNEKITIGNIDSSSFMVDVLLAKKIRWEIDKYEADGIFAMKCKENSQNSIFINQPLCFYNSLRSV